MKAIKTIAILLTTLFLNITTVYAETYSTFTPEQTEQIQDIVKEYLLKNPQIMLQIFKELQNQQRQQIEKQALNAIGSHIKMLFDSPTSPVLGDKTSALTLVEFFDYQCPHCKEVDAMMNDLIKSNPNLRVILKEFPIFPGSIFMAKAALAAQNQGKFAEFHEALMKAPNPMDSAKVLQIARSVGLKTKKLQREMQSDAIKQELSDNVQLAQALGIIGTPSFIVANVKDGKLMKAFFIPGVVSQAAMQDMLEQARKAG